MKAVRIRSSKRYTDGICAEVIRAVVVITQALARIEQRRYVVVREDAEISYTDLTQKTIANIVRVVILLFFNLLGAAVLGISQLGKSRTDNRYDRQPIHGSCA